LKICDLTQFYSPVSGGVRRYLEQKVAYLRRERPDCRHLLIIPGEKHAVSGDDRVRVCTIASPLVSRTSRYRALLNLKAVEAILEREKPSIIESGDPYQLAWKAVASGRGLNIPVVGFYHSHFPEAFIRTVSKYFGSLAASAAEESSRHYVTALYNSLERTFVPSPVLAQLLRGWGVQRVENIDLGVDTEIFRPAEIPKATLRAELGVPIEPRLLLYVGRLAAEKNVRTLFEAFQLLHEREPGRYHLLAVGDGGARSALLRLREATGAITWLQYCADSRRLAEIYRAADLFVHPGVQETFGLVTLESQACGTPVVGIRGSYMDRIIFSNQAPWADENTPESLARAIETKFHSDLRFIGLQASEAARARYSWKTVFSHLFASYEEVVAGYRN